MRGQHEADALFQAVAELLVFGMCSHVSLAPSTQQLMQWRI